MPQRAPSTVQTLIFDKTVFKTAEAARAWAKRHDFHFGKVDETEDSFRLRQEEPEELQEGSFRTMVLTRGVKAVIGRQKR